MRKFMLPIILICLLFLLIGSLASNALAQASFGTLELQVVAGKPADFNDPPLTGGKYRASNAMVLIYPKDQPDSGFSFDGYADKEGIVIAKDLLVGPNKYEIAFYDFKGDLWKAEGLVYIKGGSWEKKFVELKKET